jgi:hypothetical protein
VVMEVGMESSGKKGVEFERRQEVFVKDLNVVAQFCKVLLEEWR